MRKTAAVWQEESIVQEYLGTVRGAIPFAREQLEMMRALLGIRQKPVRRFLDLGCGDGVLSAAILESYPRARGVLVDFSAPMLAAGQEKLVRYGTQVRFVQADFGHPDWRRALPDGAPFEAVVSGFAIHHQTDRRKRVLYGEIKELLAPGGWFVNIEHVSPACATTHNLFEEAMVALLIRSLEQQGQAANPRSIRRQWETRKDQADNILAPVERQLGWLRRLGFEEVDCYLKYCELAVLGGRKPQTTEAG